jgi:hypothetical protein
MRLTVVGLLVWGAYWAALPWIDCLRAFPPAVSVSDKLTYCTFGIAAYAVPGKGLNLVAGGIYLAAAAWASSRGGTSRSR